MLSPMSPIVRPCRITYRLTTSGTKTNFRLPFQAGWYGYAMVGAGQGGGATHTSFADPSERGANGQLRSSGYTFRRAVINGQISSMIIGDAGLGGTATNNTDVAAQRGKVGGSTSWTDLGTTQTAAAGSGAGRCAFEATGLTPTQLAAPYTVVPLDSRTLSTSIGWLTYLGVVHDGGSVFGTNAGRGGAGKTAPGVNGDPGNDGRTDWYFFN